MKLAIGLLNPALHKRESFYNPTSEIEIFLKTQANKEHKQNVSDTFVITKNESPEILGYFTLSLSTVHLTQLPNIYAKKLPKYQKIGCVLLGRMGRNFNCTPKGFGTILLKEALRESLKKGTFYAVEVIAKNEKLSQYYQKYGFIPLLDDSKHLYIPRNQIISALSVKTNHITYDRV